ncbi:putative membrane protein [Psychromicrobium silvestre]|uniref:Putative membrane protein n=1 Tax=Psychromicrobium silvestre TaxID=1645614 RepID=A0A7Y9LUE6_9MICC|nr:phage holin family protein [Psychromicrobium silvestre]NYE95777.1 putative membrane protein [Psychromicrobium silvestre]
MGKFLVRVLISTIALWITSWILPGVKIGTEGTLNVAQGNNTLAAVLAFLFVGLIFGVINALIRPLVKLISLPVTILTLGLFTIVINALMLWLASWLSSFTPVHFTIDSFFWTAILAAIIISVLSMIGSAVTGVNRKTQDRR